MTKQLRFRASRAQRALVPLFTALVVVIAAASCQGPTSPYGGGSSGGGGTGGGSTGTRFDLGPFALGQSATLAFPSAVIAGYHCIPHRAMGMTGTVLVDANGADSALVRIGASGFSFTPSTAHIKPGGHVRWVNVSNLAIHTVTSD